MKTLFVAGVSSSDQPFHAQFNFETSTGLMERATIIPFQRFLGRIPPIVNGGHPSRSSNLNDFGECSEIERNIAAATEHNIQSLMIWKEAEYLEQLGGIECDCRKVLALLPEAAERRGMAVISPEVAALLSVNETIMQRCRDERERLGLWREDGMEPDEILEEIDQQLSEFMKALKATLPAK